jgi:hypothetical protein
VALANAHAYAVLLLSPSLLKVSVHLAVSQVSSSYTLVFQASINSNRRDAHGSSHVMIGRRMLVV